VISRSDERAVCDAGLKASSVDSGMPVVHDRPGIKYSGAADEHGVLQLGRDSGSVRAGDQLRLIPGHCDPTVNLYDWYVCMRRNVVEELWPITARGALA
jgi:3-hydroxy-D-aspartate aldolase